MPREQGAMPSRARAWVSADVAAGVSRTNCRQDAEPTGRLELPTGGLRSRVDHAQVCELTHVRARYVSPRSALFRPHCLLRLLHTAAARYSITEIGYAGSDR
jgi:hypothetical protein